MTGRRANIHSTLWPAARPAPLEHRSLAHDTPAWIALSLLTRGAAVVSRLLGQEPCEPRAVLRKVAGRDTAALLDRAERLATSLPLQGITVLAYADAGYPWLLREIPDPPPVIFVRGHLDDGDDPAVALVGSRRPSTYGEAVARYLAEDLGAGGVTVISGLARGIDTAAHQGALIPPNGRTIAVLAHGPDTIYPPENRRLAEAIVERGALLTEFPPGRGSLKGHFPRRNRLISGLSRGVVVVEATARSGSLITARLAGEQGREVFAVPGPITAPGSCGPHDLLAAGAHPVRTAMDIVSQFPATVRGIIARRVRDRPGNEPPPGLDRHEQEIWAHLGPMAPVGVDALAAHTGLRVSDLVAALLGLEIRGLVEACPGGGYRRRDWTEGG